LSKDAKVACSLGPGDLDRRVASLAQFGADHLISSEGDAGRRLLRFRGGLAARRRLEEIARAESECCPFLDISLGEQGGELTLSVTAVEGGGGVADQLAAAFSAGSAGSA
jgi:hypothetical protein